MLATYAAAILTLQAILAAELAAGNSVQETSAWPPRCEVLVVLRYKFKQTYPLALDVTYRVLNDPHYWYAEYSFATGQQLLVCGFA